MTNNKTEGVLDKLHTYIREELMFTTESGRQPREGKNAAYYNVLDAIEDLKKNYEEPSPPAGVEQRAKEYAEREIVKNPQPRDPDFSLFEVYRESFIAGSESQGQQAVIQILPDDEKNWFPMECENCGWIGSSGDASGGGQIADTGDYDDPLCPCCLSKKVDEVDNKQPLSSYVDRLKKAGEAIKKLTEQYDELYWKTLPPPHTA